MGLMRLRGVLAVERALRLRQAVTNHTMQTTIKTSALSATMPRMAGIHFPIISRDSEISLEMANDGATETPFRPTYDMFDLGVQPRSLQKSIDPWSGSMIDRNFM